MRILIAAIAIVPLVAPLAPAAATPSRYDHHYVRHHHYTQCRHSAGTTGLVAGGVGGALVGNSILGHGVLGTVAGGVGGAFAGRAIDRTVTAHKRCR